VLDLNGAPVGQKGESCRVFFFLAYSLTRFVLADTLLADTDDNKEEDIDDKEEEDIDDKEEDVSDKEEDVANNKKGNEYATNNMLPKLKLAAATPPKMTVKKEPGVEKLATFVSKKLKISTPAFKPFSMKMLDGYMVKPYCQKIYQLCGG
jgi:hypothetical protein